MVIARSESECVWEKEGGSIRCCVYYHQEYLTCWKIIFVHIKPNWRYRLRKSLQCYRKNIGNTHSTSFLYLNTYKVGKTHQRYE